MSNFMSVTTGTTASGDDEVFVPAYSHVMYPAGSDALLNAGGLASLTAHAGNTGDEKSSTPETDSGSVRIRATTVAGVGADAIDASAHVPVGGGFTLTANASGFTPAAWQWYRDNAVINGANANDTTYDVTNANAGAHAGAYSVAVTTNAGEIVNSGAFTVIVETLAAPLITTHPVSQTITVDDSVTFTVSATGENPGETLTYQWQKGGVNISGAINASHTITDARQSDVASYRVIVTNAAGSSVISDAATLTVNTSGGGNNGGNSGGDGGDGGGGNNSSGGGGGGGGGSSSGGGSGGGGGGALSIWHLAVIAGLMAMRALHHKRV
jgi:hypothetical protein